jgi:hypothetical protein
MASKQETYSQFLEMIYKQLSGSRPNSDRAYHGSVPSYSMDAQEEDDEENLIIPQKQTWSPKNQSKTTDIKMMFVGDFAKRLTAALRGKIPNGFFDSVKANASSARTSIQNITQLLINQSDLYGRQFADIVKKIISEIEPKYSGGMMAYREETEQQFFETIVRQARGPMRRPFGDQQYHGNHYSGGHASEDDNFADFDPQEDGYEVAEPETVDTMRGRMSSFTKPYTQGRQIGSEFAEPSPDALSHGFGGYSSESGSRHLPAKPAPNVGMEPRVEMMKIKKEIKAKETELHELQKRKVELMRKITGRL